MVPFFGQARVELFHERQQGPLRRESPLVFVNRDVLIPSKSLPVWRKPKAVEEIFSTHERDIPKARNSSRIFFDGDFALESLQDFPPLWILLQMFAHFVKGGKYNRRAHKQHRLMLQRGHDDLMRRANAVNVGRAIRDAEIARIHHPQINMQRFPELPRAPGTRLRALLATGVGPTVANALSAFDILAAVFVQPPHLRFEPGIENRHPEVLQNLAHPVSPARLLFRRPRRHKIHGPRKINARPAQQTALVLRARHLLKVTRGDERLKYSVHACQCTRELTSLVAASHQGTDWTTGRSNQTG